ncbi:MAG: hypothetical protein CM1200mP10_12120 [Candidatus Neomarinimicrobiota bacterium]|nr:MAG: hypothetical protein CM1200mP10_12120 [Candidatus Neomarinimicrobiota bacterium]
MVEKLTLAQKAFDELEEMIVNLHLKPGQIYSEKELTQILGFGRTPLREALQKMASIDLLGKNSTKGYKNFRDYFVSAIGYFRNAKTT